jgi:hypothetical protein
VSARNTLSGENGRQLFSKNLENPAFLADILFRLWYTFLAVFQFCSRFGGGKPQMATTAAGKKRMTQSEVINHFAEKYGMKRAQVKQMFEDIANWRFLK